MSDIVISLDFSFYLLFLVTVSTSSLIEPENDGLCVLAGFLYWQSSEELVWLAAISSTVLGTLADAAQSMGLSVTQYPLHVSVCEKSSTWEFLTMTVARGGARVSWTRTMSCCVSVRYVLWDMIIIITIILMIIIVQIYISNKLVKSVCLVKLICLIISVCLVKSVRFG